jgi:hypothetical protein
MHDKIALVPWAKERFSVRQTEHIRKWNGTTWNLIRRPGEIMQG